MNFLIDNQLPSALARLIATELRSDAKHVLDVGLERASDAAIWNYASSKNLILVSKDEDFADMILAWPTAKLIWVRVGNCRRDLLLHLFRRMWPRILKRLEAGETLIEIR